MLNKIRLKNFKCFGDVCLNLRYVNLLTGINGMGKSTVLQSLLALRQSVSDGRVGRLCLNGSYVKLGNAEDVQYSKAQDDQVCIALQWEDGTERTFAFQYRSTNDIGSDVLPCLDGVAGELPEGLLPVYYLAADRITPGESFGYANNDQLERRMLGNDGSYSLQYLYKYGDKAIASEMCVPGARGQSLFEQVVFWMGRISRGAVPRVAVNDKERRTVLQYTFREGEEETDAYKNVNVGFGLTYILPVIIFILAAHRGDILLLENPEAHLHPAGQRAMGELIDLAGRAGIQVLAETHSDHVFNGIRVDVAREKIRPEDVKLFYFDQQVEAPYDHFVLEPTIDADGMLDEWPKGFFDEWEKALLDL